VRHSSPLSILFIVAGLLFSAGFACNDGGNNNMANTAAPVNSASANASTSASPGPAKKIDIAGKYETTGTNPNGGQYKADLEVKPHQDVYQFSWTSGKNAYDGVGVMTDTEVAVSYTDGPNGKGCGVVLYKINSDGSLDGKTGYWGVNSIETEKATRTSGSDLEGAYSIEGKNPEGKDYKGTLEVKKAGSGYSFKWNAGTTFEGFGIRAGDLVAVGFGGKQCSFIGYDIKDDGTLDGRWGGQGATSFGTEVAKKK
jgi:hypothetical protein